MPVRDIRTSISLDGEKEFRKAIDDANRSLRVMNSDLKAVAAEFGVTGDKQRYMAERSGLLKDRIAQQEKIVEALTGAVRDSAAAHGEASRETDGYRIKLNNAKTALNKMKQELVEADREAEELGRDSVRVGRQIEDGIGDGAKEAQQSLSDMIRQMQEDVGSIQNAAAFNIASQVGSFVVGSISNMMSFVESYRDTRQKRAVALSGIQSEMALTEAEIDRYLLKIVGITGDSDAAYEALQLLGQAGIDEGFFEKVIEYMLGAYIKLGEEARPENFAESIQESARSGGLTGAIEAVYIRLGEDVEAMNEAMKNLPPEERVNAILTGLAGHGLSETYQDFLKNNADLVAEQKAAENLALAWAALAATLSPIVADIMDVLTYVVDEVSAFVKKVKEMGFLPAILDEAFGVDSTANSDLYDAEGNLNPAVQEAWNMSNEEAAAFVEQYGPNAKRNEPTQKAAEAGKRDGKQYAESMQEAVYDALPSFEDVVSAFALSGPEAAKGWLESLVLMEEDKEKVVDMLETLGIDSGDMFGKGLTDAMNTAIENAKISGANSVLAIGQGIADQSPVAVAAAWNMANQINAAYASIGAGLRNPVVGRFSYSGAPAIYLDVKKVGEAIAPTVSGAIGRSSTRLSRLG